MSIELKKKHSIISSDELNPGLKDLLKDLCSELETLQLNISSLQSQYAYLSDLVSNLKEQNAGNETAS